jgi:hypothetical protein
MESMNAVVQDLEKQDIHRLLSEGMSSELVDELEGVCESYLEADAERRKNMRATITGKGTSVILIFLGQVANRALQLKDIGAIDVGIAALDLSNIMNIDYRDAFGPASVLSYAAKQCGIDVVHRARTLLPEISSELIELLSRPKQPRLARDVDGNVVFWNPWSKSLPRNTP